MQVVGPVALIALLHGVVAAQQAGNPGKPAIDPFAPAIAADAPDAERLRERDAAAARGLAWLATHQLRSGCWTGIVGHKQQNDYMELDIALGVAQQRASGRGHMGVTALCGLAFLAGGHLPDRGEHGEVVRRTIDYVVANVHENGLIADSGTRMYSHAFATLFLAQCYGMAGGERMKTSLERAVNMIVDGQNQYGAWRYNPFDREADLSVTVCQVQSLRAARNIGIKVPNDTIARAIDYVMQSRVPSGRSRGRFWYKIHGSGAHQKPDEYAINAAALTALASAGIYDDAVTAPVLDFLEREYADVADYAANHFYYWYGNYYACQAFFQAGGPRFKTFYERLANDLVRMQQSDGRWVNTCGPGDEFSTAVACLLLQLPRQYLPIFQR